MRLLLVICGALLLTGMADLPIGYYTLIRFTTKIGAAWIVYREISDDPGPSVILFGLIAILFNPIIPVHLNSKGIWQILDTLCGIGFVWKSWTLRWRNQES